MISVVVCHRSPDYLAQLGENIRLTIGCEFELIVIDNQENKYSIFQAYNEGARRSKFEYICFAHEDILFHTRDWGVKVVSHFKDISIGMIGVVGGTVMPKSPAPWWSSLMVNDHLVNIIQHWKTPPSDVPYHTTLSKENNRTITRDYSNPTGENVVDAAVLDGLWFCIRRGMFQTGLLEFDTHTFKGFHCYDSDISLQVKRHARVCVVYDILIEHFQQGTINQEWFQNVLALNRKWRSELPVITKDADDELYRLFEWNTLQTFVFWLEGNGFSQQFIRAVIKEVAPYLAKSRTNIVIQTRLLLWAKYGKFISRMFNAVVKLTKK